MFDEEGDHDVPFVMEELCPDTPERDKSPLSPPPITSNL